MIDPDEDRMYRAQRRANADAFVWRVIFTFAVVGVVFGLFAL